MSNKEGFFNKNDLILYLYGALLGSAPAWIILYLLFSTGIINNDDLTTIILFSQSLISGLIAAYFVCRATKSSEQSSILITGAFSYLFASIIFSIYGYKGGFTEEMAIIAGYLLGASIGGKLWEKVGEEYEYIEVEIDDEEEENSET